MSDVFEVYDAWELLDADERKLKRLNARDWRTIGDALGAVHGRSAAAPTSATPGLNQGISIAEGSVPLSNLGPHILLFDLVWLPDPVYSLVSEEAHQVHALLPDRGGVFFDPHKPIHVSRKSVWSMRPLERLPFLRAEFPRLTRRLRDLRAFHDLGALRLHGWEPTIGAEAATLREDVRTLKDAPFFQEISQRHRQIEYNLGAFVGALGIEAGEGMGADLPKGTPLWIADKTPLAVYGLMNALVAARQGATLVPDRPGDVEVLTALSTGTTSPQTNRIGPAFLVPQFTEATWSALPTLRANSDALAELRRVVSRVAEAPADALDLADEVEASARRLREQASLWEMVGKDATEVGINVAGGTAAGAALGGATGALIGSVAGSFGTALKIVGRLADYRAASGKREGAEILVNLARTIRDA